MAVSFGALGGTGFALEVVVVLALGLVFWLKASCGRIKTAKTMHKIGRYLRGNKRSVMGKLFLLFDYQLFFRAFKILSAPARS